MKLPSDARCVIRFIRRVRPQAQVLSVFRAGKVGGVTARPARGVHFAVVGLATPASGFHYRLPSPPRASESEWLRFNRDSCTAVLRLAINNYRCAIRLARYVEHPGSRRRGRFGAALPPQLFRPKPLSRHNEKRSDMVSYLSTRCGR